MKRRDNRTSVIEGLSLLSTVAEASSGSHRHSRSLDGIDHKRDATMLSAMASSLPMGSGGLPMTSIGMDIYESAIASDLDNLHQFREKRMRGADTSADISMLPFSTLPPSLPSSMFPFTSFGGINDTLTGDASARLSLLQQLSLASASEYPAYPPSLSVYDILQSYQPASIDELKLALSQSKFPGFLRGDPILANMASYEREMRNILMSRGYNLPAFPLQTAHRNLMESQQRNLFSNANESEKRTTIDESKDIYSKAKNDIDSKLQLLVLLLHEFRKINTNRKKELEVKCNNVRENSAKSGNTVVFANAMKSFLTRLLCGFSSTEVFEEVLTRDAVLDIRPLSSLIWRRVLQNPDLHGRNKQQTSMLLDLLTKSNLDFSSICGPSSAALVSQILYSLLKLEFSSIFRDRSHQWKLPLFVTIDEQDIIVSPDGHAVTVHFTWRSQGLLDVLKSSLGFLSLAPLQRISSLPEIEISGLLKCDFSSNPSGSSDGDISESNGASVGSSEAKFGESSGSGKHRLPIQTAKVIFDPCALLRQCMVIASTLDI